MIDGLKPYREAKATNLPWLPTIPAHWDVRRIKTLLRERDRRTETGEEPLLSLRMREGIVDHLAAGGKPLSNADLVGYKIVDCGMLVMNRMRASSGLFGVSPSRGLVSPDYAIFRSVSLVDTSYVLYLFKTPMLAQIFRAESKGLGTGEAGFLRLYTDRFGLIGIPLPPIEEQRLIVRFLDAHGALTARLLRAKQRLIKLLEEQRQAIIHRAVTRGLDPNVPLKPSGIPRLGEIPAHWEIKRIKTIAQINPSKSELRAFDPGTKAAFLPMERVETDGRIFPVEHHSVSELLAGFTYFRRGDVILAKITPCFENGKGALVNELPTEIGFGSTEFIVLRAKAQIHPRFLYLLTIEPQFRRLGANAMTGSAGQKRVSPAFAGAYYVGLPPLPEQKAVIRYIGDATAKIAGVISDLGREVALLREFRARLIADVVTGKLDVRMAAAALPEMTEAEPIDEPTDGEDLEEAIDDAEDEEVAA